MSISKGKNTNQLPKTSFPGDNSSLAPPDPISNSEVKRTSADDSVRLPHVKVGHRQGFIKNVGLHYRLAQPTPHNIQNLTNQSK